MNAAYVTVRMYKGLLGDCFLLRLFASEPAAGRQEVADAHILIDCGIIQRAPQEAALIRRVAEDIRASCGGRLDLVAVTHEHYDHLSGFGTARDIFLDAGGLQIDHLWLAWTEKDGDPQAERLRALAEETRMAIDAGVQRIAARATESADQEFDLLGDAMGLDGFIGPMGAKSQERLSGRQVLARLKDKVKPREEDFLEPGQARDTPGQARLRAYVLGPPRNEDLLFRERASTSPGKRETYLASREAEARAAARNFATCDQSCGLDGVPFSKRYRQVEDAVLLDPQLGAPPPGSGTPQERLWSVRGRYLKAEDSWRRIDTDWHGAVSELALKLDSDTNNTSLVLAFELEAGGDVLLFAADAQVGNWLSWHAQEYPKNASDGQRRTIEDLLAHVVLYKVGHHGSHNATLRQDGLEMMTHPAMVAMLPLVEEVARRRQWPMPFDKLYERLLEKTGSRILRGDAAPDAAVLAAQPDFAARVREKPDDGSGLGPLWVEYDVR